MCSLQEWQKLIFAAICDCRSEGVVGREMAIPLPIPHPAHISVIIHNRETETPFQWETPIAQAIIKALQVRHDDVYVCILSVQNKIILVE